MNSLSESQYNFPEGYGNRKQAHADQTLHLKEAKALKLPYLREGKPLLKSECDFIKGKKRHTMPKFLLDSASPENQHNMPALYS